MKRYVYYIVTTIHNYGHCEDEWESPNPITKIEDIYQARKDIAECKGVYPSRVCVTFYSLLREETI